MDSSTTKVLQVGIRPRVWFAGAVFCAALAVGAPYTRNILPSSLLDGEFLPFGVILGLLVLVGLANPAARAVFGRSAFTPQELALLFIMGITTTAVSTDGLAAFLIAIIAAPYHFAAPENRWPEFLLPHLPSWLVPSNAGGEMRLFFTGLPGGQGIPWSVWIVPLFWWLSLFAATFFVCACLVVVLRKQWAEHERLTFPLMEIPLAMAAAPEGRSLWPPMFRSRLFIAGFLVPFFVVTWNIGAFFSPGFPEITMDLGWIQIARDFPAVRALIIVPIVGFAYFVQLHALFSVWVFYLLGIIQVGIYNRVGFQLGPADIYCSSHPSMGWQGYGALTAMVLWSLWMARRHLWSALKQAAVTGRSSEESGLFSYRTAFIGMVLGWLYILFWLWQSGMELRMAGIFIFAAFIIFLGLSRIVIQCGIVFVRAPLTAQSFTLDTLGTTAIPAAGMVSLGLTYSWIHTVFFFMPVVAHATRLADVLRVPGRHIRRALCLALLVAVPTTLCFHIVAGYYYGAENFDGWAFKAGCTLPYQSVVSKMANPANPNWACMGFFAIGAVVFLIITQLHYRFSWWPLHPIGMTIAATHPTTMIAFSVFIAWLAKWIIVKVGGHRAYEGGKPLFLGLVAGYFAGLAVALLVDILFFGPGQGHRVYSL